MFGLYTPLFLLQAFCIYHAYQNRAEQRWYWFILIFPGVGSAIYLYHHFYNRKSISSIAESVKEVVNTNYRLEQLEKAFRFSDNLKNRINLADAYVDYQRYEDAIQLYKEALTGIMEGDAAISMKLLNAYFLNKNYNEGVALGTTLEKEKVFRNSEARLAYAWCLHYAGQTDVAEKVFSEMDKPSTNYKHRVEYSKFLIEISNKEKLQLLLVELLEEFDHMHGPERKIHRDIIREIQQMYSTNFK